MHIAYLPLEQLRIGARTPVISPSNLAISLHRPSALCALHEPQENREEIFREMAIKKQSTKKEMFRAMAM
jgi:hypothetical protein